VKPQVVNEERIDGIEHFGSAFRMIVVEALFSAENDFSVPKPPQI
jgi:hypothetical protein